MRTLYLNGEYLPEVEAKISAFDRGFLFAEAAYEVTAVLDGKLVDFDRHMERLTRSLDGLGFDAGIDRDALLLAHRQLVSRNSLSQGVIYLQISRGAGDRDFLPPQEPMTPTILMFAQDKNILKNPADHAGQSVITVPDLRWQRGDLKTVQLVYACSVKSRARALGAGDAWLTRDGKVTESASGNAFIVTRDNRLITTALSSDILSGITRGAVLTCAEMLDLTIEERPFDVAEAKAAIEAFSTSASTFVMPVVRIDDIPVGTGALGPVTRRIWETYVDRARRASI